MGCAAVVRSSVGQGAGCLCKPRASEMLPGPQGKDSIWRKAAFNSWGTSSQQSVEEVISSPRRLGERSGSTAWRNLWRS